MPRTKVNAVYQDQRRTVEDYICKCQRPMLVTDKLHYSTFTTCLKCGKNPPRELGIDNFPQM